MTDRWLEYLPLDGLEPNPDNVKRHDVAGVAASMSRFGLVDAIVIDERTGRIASGHGRVDSLRSARAAARPPPEGVDERDGTWWVPVNRGWSSTDDREAAAAAVAVNRWTERGGWDTATLLDRLDSLADGPLGLVGVGFGVDDIDDLFARLGPPDPPPPDDPSAQVRTLLLDYPLDTFRWMATATAAVRAATGADSNAELFALLLEAEG